MSIEDEAKPSDRSRKKQPPKAKASSEIKPSAELETQLTELVSMLRGANLPAVFEKQSKLETKIESLVKAAEEQTKADKLRAEHDEKRFKKLQEDHLELIGHVKKITGIVPRIEEFSTSFAEISGGVKAIDSRVHSLSEGVVELKTFAEGQQMNLFTLIESAAESKSSISAIGAGIEGIAEKTAEIEEKLTNGYMSINQQLDLFAASQQAITATLDDLKLAVEPLATRQDVSLTVENSRRKTRRTIKAIAALGHKEGEKAMTAQRKHHVAITRQSLKAVDKFVKATAQRLTKETVELTDATKELTASVAESTTEIQESKATLKDGARVIVNAQRALLEIGPFVENQIMSSMNLVVTTVAPQLSNSIKSLIDSADLKSIPALANQFELLLDETGKNIEEIRNVGDLVRSSNNNAATTNRDLMNQMGSMKSVADELMSRLSGEDLLQVSGKIELLSKNFTRNLEDYKVNVTSLFSNLTNIMVNQLTGDLAKLLNQNKLSQEELLMMAEVITNQITLALIEDHRKDV
jgi:hypothetical protein